MKRVYYLIVVLLSLSVVFVSCEKPTTGGEDDKSDAIVLTDVYDVYYSTQFVEGVSNDYWMTFTTDDVVMVEGTPMGTGEFIYVEVFPVSVEGNFPAGKYVFAEDPEDGFAWAGWEYDMGPDLGMEEGIYVIPQGSFSYVLSDDDLVDTKYMVGGYVEISGTSADAEVFVNAVFADGTKGKYLYKGELEFVDYDEESGSGTGGEDGGELGWDYEPTEKGDYTATFDYCSMSNWGDYYGDGIDYLDMTLNGDEWYAVLNLCAPLNSGENVYGTYKVESGYGDWSVVPSPGGDYYYDYASFVATGLDEDGAYSIAYYIASGTVVVAQDGVTFDVVSHYGSTIKGEYKGEVIVEDKRSEYAPTRILSKDRPYKLVKASVEDMVYFGLLKSRVRK